MRKKLAKICTFTLIFIIILTAFVYNYKFAWRQETIYAMDTIVTIKIRGTSNQLRELVSLVEGLEKEFDVYDAQSNLYKINSEGKGEVTANQAELIGKALELAEMTEGAFDPTVKPVTDLWAITSDEPRVPLDNEIEEIINKVDYRNVETDGRTLILKSEAELDVGGVAKGYISDKLNQEISEMGLKETIIDLGGNIYSCGKTHNIGIQKPFGQRGETEAVVKALDEAVVTSGVYERGFEADGRYYHHIFDPETGKPADKGVLSVTVINKDATLCDGLSTALLVMGEERAKSFADSHKEIQFMMVTEDKIILANGIDERVSLTTDKKKEIWR